MGKTNNTKSGRRKTKKSKRMVRGVAFETVTIEDILTEGNARSRFEELVKKGFPEDFLKEVLTRYPNSSDKRTSLIPNMNRKQAKKLVSDALDLAGRIKRANESVFFDPRLNPTPGPGPGQEHSVTFRELPTMLALFAHRINKWLLDAPRPLFDSDRQHMELVLVAMSIHYTGEKNYAAIADLLTAALDASDELSATKRITRAALLQLVNDHPQDMDLARQEIVKHCPPAKEPAR